MIVYNYVIHGYDTFLEGPDVSPQIFTSYATELDVIFFGLLPVSQME